MELDLVLVPYHLGMERIGMGLGPERFLEAGVHYELGSRGHSVHIHTIQQQTKTRQDEVTAIAEINALLAEQVREKLRQGHFPIILAGNCNACLGTLAGIETRPVGVIWLDAHGDFNTPEASASGFLDGMALAMAAGLCHQAVWITIGNTPIHSSHIVHIGGRDFDEGEEERLISHQAQVVSAKRLKQAGLAKALRPALAALRSQVAHVYLHVDLDVLNPAEGRANEYAAPNGPALRKLEDVIQMVGEEFVINAATLAAYNPAYDGEGRALGAGLRMIYAIVDTVVAQREHEESD